MGWWSDRWSYQVENRVQKPEKFRLAFGGVSATTKGNEHEIFETTTSVWPESGGIDNHRVTVRIRLYDIRIGSPYSIKGQIQFSFSELTRTVPVLEQNDDPSIDQHIDVRNQHPCLGIDHRDICINSYSTR